MTEKNCEDTNRRQWSCLYSEHGKMEVLTDRAGVVFIRGFPYIVAYSRGLLHSSLTRLVFHIPGPSGRWYQVTLLKDDETSAEQFVIIKMRLIKSPFNLTFRELDILTLIAAGFSNEAIASHLHISFRTAEKHTERLLQKTGFRNRSGLAGYAVDRGYLRLPTPGGVNNSQLSTSIIEKITLKLSDKKEQVVSVRKKKNPLIIGIPVIESGRGFSDTLELIQGTELAVAEINKQGGIRGRKIKILTEVYNTDSEKEKIAAYSSMINNEVDAIISGYACYSPVAWDMVGESGIPCLHVATLNSAVERVRSVYNNLFQSCATDIHYSIGLKRFIRSLPEKFLFITAGQRLAIIKPFGAELDIGIHYIEKHLEAEGWSTFIVPVYSDTFSGWYQALEELHHIQPSVIVLASFFAEDAIAFQKLFMKNPIPCIVYCIYSPSVPLYLQELGNQCEGVVWATTCGISGDFFGRRFRHNYLNYFNKTPGNSQASLAYDRVNILAASWSRCVYPGILSNVVSDLRHSIIRGVNGVYFFGKRQQCLTCPDNTQDLSISQIHLTYQIQHNRNVIIEPDFCSESHFSLPSWF